MEKFHVLIIDDDRDIAGYFQAVLSLMGFEVDQVQSAREALAVLATSVPNLILLDMRLGRELGGEDILYQIRSNPRFDNTRVIVITGYPSAAEMVTSLADLILIKPVEVEQLKNLVTRVTSYEVAPKSLPFRDPVTMLFNKDFFFTRLELAFERYRRHPEFPFAVVVFQIQLASQVTELANSEASITILSSIAQRLMQNLRPTDTVARVSGWKFVALIEDLHKNEDVDVILKRMREILTERYIVGDHEYEATVEFGLAFHEPHYRKPAQIFDAAESALEKSQPQP